MRLPEGWVRATLGELGDLISGGTPSKARSDFWGGGIPWVSPKDMKVLVLDDTEDHVSQTALEQTVLRVIPVGSVLIVVRSGILAHTLPIAVTRVEVTINQDLKALPPIGGLHPYYLAWFLRSAARDILNTCTKAGTTVASVRTASLVSYPVPLAPTAEQGRIVAKLDELFSELDAGVTALERARAKLERSRASVLMAGAEGRLRQSMLKHAFEGRLVPQDPNDEPASVLLARIRAERESAAKKPKPRTKRPRTKAPSA